MWQWNTPDNVGSHGLYVVNKMACVSISVNAYNAITVLIRADYTQHVRLGIRRSTSGAGATGCTTRSH